MNISLIISSAYLIAICMFIIGFMRMHSPATGRSGSLVAACGMMVGIGATLIDKGILSYNMIILGIAIGAVGGVWLGRRVKITAMPQMVGLLNGLGGMASLIIAIVELLHLITTTGDEVNPAKGFVIGFTVLIGGVTFWGSLIACGKLQGIVTSRPITYSMQKTITAAMAMVGLGLIIYLGFSLNNMPLLISLVIISSLLGILLVLPIGGADMPVVICLMNSYSGIAVVGAGFVINNVFLIVSGALVGASGILLAVLMGKGMNRSISNVMFGAFGAVAENGKLGLTENKPVHKATADDVAALLSSVKKVIFVPGYGMAVAQAQHGVSELGSILESRGVDVKYAIHPVAGRMPGHMYVLLAEADIAYNKLYPMEDINSDFERTDVAVVIGANDVINPDARNQPGSPLYGMPILNVDKARHIVVIKRSLSPGFSGVDNPLFYLEKTLMFFQDGREALDQIISAIKNY